MQRQGTKAFSHQSLHRTAEGEKELKEEKPGSWDQQRAKHQNLGDAEAVMTSIIFLENTLGFVVVAGNPLGGESTNSTFSLNFPPKFLEFSKWSLIVTRLQKSRKSIRKTIG